MKKLLLTALAACSVISAQANLFQYSVTLSGGLNESPTNTSTGTGFGTVDYNDSAHTLSLSVTFSGLTGSTTVSHIHAATAVAGSGTAGVATQTPSFVGFPTGVSGGNFSAVLDLTQASSWNSAFIGAGTPATAEVALANAMAAGKAYWNIHTSFAPSGEIRGFLTAVPEPSTFALAGLVAIGMAARVWNRKRQA